ncbi:hypothetical protein C7S10_05545 [Nocardioides currus]|uniref:Uncharacterized protein n=1 Tax=Nocardioides currus TaxID=2133958 RepID=A0A2R7YYV5_9ACTN|nr:hypothetical protein C7S10_05545 [Nocardioides currus]
MVAIATAAPAFAASPCSDTYSYRLDWGTTPYTPPANLTVNPNVATAIVPALPGGGPGASAVTVTLTSTLQGGVTRYDQNLNVLATTGIGGFPGEQGVAIRSATTGLPSVGGPLGISRSQTITFGFSRAVRNLSFTVVDLDRDTNFWDRASFSPTPTSYVRVGTVQGNGNTGTELTADSGGFRYTGLTGIDDTSNAGNVTITYAGGSSFTSFQLVYWNAGTPGPQGILVSDLTFNALGC